jgi:hypothetical protein
MSCAFPQAFNQPGVSMPPPTRPKTVADLTFPQRRPVNWFSPPTLARAAAKVILSAAFGEYLDKRELQQTLAGEIVADETNSKEVWIDFVADTGDGFDPTYSVAWCVSQPAIQPAGLDFSLPRAHYLIFGGDEVYPYATPKEYDERFRGPYKAALPWTEEDPTRPDARYPCVLAIPGNHDWYDGLTGFMRVFAQRGWIGGRERKQARSYFAVRLPGPFWLWGIDIGTDSYVDAAQMSYFEHAAGKMNPGDRLILCTAKPSWTDLADDPDAYRNLSFVERELVPKNVRTVLMLSGDQHHYARYEAANDEVEGTKRMKITSGGGGAFLSPTHQLKSKVNVPVVEAPGETSISVTDSQTEPFKLERRYPEVSQSRRLTPRVILLGVRNPSFLMIPALIYLLLNIASVSGARSDALNALATQAGTAREVLQPDYVHVLTGGYSPAIAVIFLVLWALLAGFITLPKRVHGIRSVLSRGVVGLVHTLCHVAVQAAFALVFLQQFGGIGDLRCVLLGAVMASLVGAVVGTLIFSAFLGLVFTLFNWNTTEAFSAFRYEGYKNFVRMHVTSEKITLYPIGIDRICRSWEADPGYTSSEASWLKPKDDTLTARLIDGPLILR